MAERLQTEVLIIGAGPVGLALAGDLGRRGHKVVIVDRLAGTVEQPKMDMIGIRTMEFCRRWGLTDVVKAAGYNRAYPQDNVFLTTLRGYEIGRQIMPSMAEDRPPEVSPAQRERCPQNFFDPVLQKFARSSGADLRFKTGYKGLVQDADKVIATVVNLDTDEAYEVEAAYLVACDGGNSTVRKELDIGMSGRGLLTYTTNVIFRAEGFNDLHDKTPGYRYMFIDKDGAWGTIVAIDGRDKWRMSIIGAKTPQPFYTDEEVKDFAYRMVGCKFDLEVLSILPWIRSELIADTYRQGRVFLCGDACHRTSPTAGLGMNTGIGDAVDLSWKLSAALQGWGGERLLDSYEIERLPIAKRICNFSTGNLQTMKGAQSNEALADDTEEGRATRKRLAAYLDEGLRREWFSLNMHLGYRYLNSPVVIYNEREDPAQQQAEFDEAIVYTPSTRPGARAPHAWLRDGRSTLDLFGSGFVLVCFEESDEEAARAAFAPAAKSLGLPLEILRIRQPEIANLYDKRFILVRPDDHIAWRDDAVPSDVERVLAQVTGNTPCLSHNECRQAPHDAPASLKVLS